MFKMNLCDKEPLPSQVEAAGTRFALLIQNPSYSEKAGGEVTGRQRGRCGYDTGKMGAPVSRGPV